MVAIETTVSEMKFKFGNVYGCRHRLNDGIMGVTDVSMGKNAFDSAQWM